MEGITLQKLSQCPHLPSVPRITSINSSSSCPTFNYKLASLALELPDGYEILGTVLDVISAQLAFGSGPLDFHFMAEGK